MPIYIYGAGGHGRVIASAAEAAGLEVLGFFDDDPSRQGQKIDNYPILGSLDPSCIGEAEVVLGIGENDVRSEVAEELDTMLRWATIIHPTAVIHHSVQLEAGAVIFAGAVIQPGVMIGKHVIVNTSSSIDHDCRIDDFVHIAPGSHLAGGVHVGRGALLGISSAVIPGCTIGESAIVGASGLVIEDVEPRTTVVGVPARPITRRA